MPTSIPLVALEIIIIIPYSKIIPFILKDPFRDWFRLASDDASCPWTCSFYYNVKFDGSPRGRWERDNANRDKLFASFTATANSPSTLSGHHLKYFYSQDAGVRSPVWLQIPRRHISSVNQSEGSFSHSDLAWWQCHTAHEIWFHDDKRSQIKMREPFLSWFCFCFLKK